MAFQTNQFNNGNSGMNQGGEKKKTNFRVGKVYGTDGTIDVSIWNSDKGGVYAILSCKAAVGKDPSTGANVYEQKMSGELPSIFMNMELVCAFLEGVKIVPDLNNINMTIDTRRGSKMSITGTGNAIKITIDNQKTGTRTITLESTPIGNDHVHANFKNMIKMLEICYKKAIVNKLDPEEFAMAISEEDANGNEAPF